MKFNVKLELNQGLLLKIRTVCHILIAIHHCYTSIWFLSLNVMGFQNQKMIELMRFADRYLTGWNFALQVVYFGIALYCDYGELRPNRVREEKLQKLKSFRDFLFTSLVFPGSMFVAIMFWIVFTLDREMVLPAECDKFIPMWINHSTHTWIIPIVLLEIVLQPRMRPKDETPNLMTLVGYQLFYSAVMFGTYFSTGSWIYPIYNSLTWLQRSLFLALIFYMSITFYYVGWRTNDLFWKRAELETGTEEQKDESERPRIENSENSRNL